MQINEIAAHAACLSQMKHLLRRWPVSAYLRDHIVGACVAGEVDENIDALFLNALRNCKLATAVKKPSHVQEALDRLHDLTAPRAVVVLIQRERGGENASSIVQTIDLGTSF